VQQVSPFVVLDDRALAQLDEAGIVVTEFHPAGEPRLTLSEAAATLEEAGVLGRTGALVQVNADPQPQRFLRGQVLEVLTWAMRVDTTESSVPDLFDPEAGVAIAFVDAETGNLLGVVTD